MCWIRPPTFALDPVTGKVDRGMYQAVMEPVPGLNYCSFVRLHHLQVNRSPIRLIFRSQLGLVSNTFLPAGIDDTFFRVQFDNPITAIDSLFGRIGDDNCGKLC